MIASLAVSGLPNLSATGGSQLAGALAKKLGDARRRPLACLGNSARRLKTSPARRH